MSPLVKVRQGVADGVARVRSSLKFRVSGPVLATLLILFAFTGLRDLDALLAAMHPPGGGAYTMSGLADVVPPPSINHTKRALETWTEQSYVTQADAADARDLSRWYFATDGVLIIGYALLLFLFFVESGKVVAMWRDDAKTQSGELQDFLPNPDESDDPRRKERQARWQALNAYVRAARVGMWALLLLVAFDLIENVMALHIVKETWAANDRVDYLKSGTFEFRVVVLQISTFFKLLAVAVVFLAAAVLVWIRLIPLLHRGKALTRGLFRARVHIAVVVVLALILFEHGQLPDVIRRWSALQALWAVGLAFLLALVVWGATRWLLEAEARGPLKNEAWVAGGIIVAGALSVAIHFVLNYPIGWGLGVPAVFLLVVLGLNIPFGAISRRTEEEDEDSSPLEGHSAIPRVLAVLVLLVVGLALMRASFGHAVYTQDWSTDAFLVLGPAIAGIMLALGWHYRGPDWTHWVPAAFIALGVGVAALLIRIFGAYDELQPSVLLAVAGMLGLGSWALYPALKLLEDWKPMWRPALIACLASCVAIGLFIAMIANPWLWGERIGGIGLLAGFLTAVALLGWAAVWLADRVDAPDRLRLFRLRRLPVVTLLVLWAVVATQLDNSDFHEVRLETVGVADRAQTVNEAFNCWRAKNGLLDRPDPDCANPDFATATPGRATPLILVASSGGGMRAAYWTTVVMDCVFELGSWYVDDGDPCPPAARVAGRRRSNMLFALSGISGGSLGLTSYAAHVSSKQETGGGLWFDSLFDQDSLSPSFGWWLFVEGPRAFLHYENAADRAEVLEVAWERAWPNGELSSYLFKFAQEHPEAPLLLLNATSVEDGCRFSVSVLDANTETRRRMPPRTLQQHDCRSTNPFDEARRPFDDRTPYGIRTRLTQHSTLAATRELSDFLCKSESTPTKGKRDIRLSTAALLSARFPLVSPSGALRRQCKKKEGEVARTFVVDGGYLEPSGAATVVELMHALGPLVAKHNAERPDRCIVPYLIQIDNGASGGAPSEPRRPNEGIVPISTLQGTRGARGSQARAQSAYVFNARFAHGAIRRDKKGTRPVMTEVVVKSGNGPARPFANRYAHFLNRAHPGPQAPLGWVLSDFSTRDLRMQMNENLEALGEVRELIRFATHGELRCVQPK